MGEKGGPNRNEADCRSKSSNNVNGGTESGFSQSDCMPARKGEVQKARNPPYLSVENRDINVS